MSILPSPPKYAAIVHAIRSRIDTGVYPVGSMLPSEADLVREFAASRSTVVRALEQLRQLGLIEGVQGKGRLVLGRPAPPHAGAPMRVRRLLDADETTGTTLLGAGRAPAPPRIAAALDIPANGPLIARQRLVPATDATPATLSTVYLPAEIATGTAFAATTPLCDPVMRHLEQRRQLVTCEVVEHLSARRPSSRETDLLRVDRSACLLTVLLVGRGADGRALFAVDHAIPATGIEEVFSLR
jgi:GntR family transcriptional regulator